MSFAGMSFAGMSFAGMSFAGMSFAGMSFAGINIFIITSAMIGIGIAAMIFHHLPDRFLFFP
jgi:hypothetical protein